MDRREFLQTVSAVALTTGLSWAAENQIERIGVQLYTVRDLFKKDFQGTLAQVAAIGYKEVEFAQYFADLGNPNPPPKRVREILDSDALAAPSGHVPYSALTAENWPEFSRPVP